MNRLLTEPKAKFYFVSKLYILLVKKFVQHNILNFFQKNLDFFRILKLFII